MFFLHDLRGPVRAVSAGALGAREVIIRLRRLFAVAMTTALMWTPLATPISARDPGPGPRLTGARQKAKKAKSGHWSPPDVDAPLASLSSSVTCPADKVLEGAADRTTELATNLQNFTAHERIVYEEVDEFGNPRASQTGTYDYLVALEEDRPGSLLVSETRNGRNSLDASQGAVTDSGLPVMVLIFHPYYSGEYNLRCEGLGEWNEHPAWVIHFEQRPDKPSHIHVFRTKDGRFPAKLRGRAWIAADTFQILHLETNLLQAIPMIHMRSEAISIDYAPVQFHTRQVILWLPQAAEVFSDFETQRYHVRHTFSDFLLFSVDINQKIEAPHPP